MLYGVFKKNIAAFLLRNNSKGVDINFSDKYITTTYMSNNFKMLSLYKYYYKF